jgi:hypothetical protein
MKTLLFLLILSTSALAQDKAKTETVTKGLIMKLDAAEARLNASYTMDQVRMREEVATIKGALYMLSQIDQDSIVIKSTIPQKKGKK